MPEFVRQTTIWEIEDPKMFFPTKAEAYRWWKKNSPLPWREAKLNRHIFFNKREIVQWLNA
jgi:hypothetical protein